MRSAQYHYKLSRAKSKSKHTRQRSAVATQVSRRLAIFRQLTYKQRWHLKQWCYITWRHLVNISERLLRMFFERSFMIINFSSRHRAQFHFPFLPAGVCLTMAHLIENCRFSFFRFQTCLDNSVSCLYFSLRRDFKWFLYLVLKSLAVTPMYICVVLKPESKKKYILVRVNTDNYHL